MKTFGDIYFFSWLSDVTAIFYSKNYVFSESLLLTRRLLSHSQSLLMRERRATTGFKAAGIATGKSNGAKSSRKESIKSANPKQTVTKPKKRAAPAQEESEDDLEDFGNVEIDINSDEEDEEINEDDAEESDDAVEEFPEDQSEDEDEEEEVAADENEDEDEDEDYMAGDSLDEEDWNEEAKIRYRHLF